MRDDKEKSTYVMTRTKMVRRMSREHDNDRHAVNHGCANNDNKSMTKLGVIKTT